MVCQAEMAISAEALVELPQREGQQRQGILGLGIVGGPLHEGLRRRQARHLGWSLDDRRDVGHRHRRQRNFLEAGGEPVFLGRLQPAEEFRAQGHQWQERQIAAHGCGEDPEEATLFFWLKPAEQLLALIDRQQDLCLVRHRCHAQIASNLRQQPSPATFASTAGSVPELSASRRVLCSALHSEPLPAARARARANSWQGWLWGGNGGTTNHPRPETRSLGSTPARSSDDLPESRRPRAAPVGGPHPGCGER